MTIVKLFLLILVVALVESQESSNPIVRTAHGLLRGAWKVSGKGRTYASFQGVPYAKAPIGKYRFREPQALKQWAGTWDATRPLSMCVQYDPFENIINGSENCLFLNIATPNIKTEARLPVLVYIHGGAFMYGAGHLYDYVFLMDRDLVVVTLNYRLGPLGFLSTGDEYAPGNAGLKDQAFALKWVKQNIHMFGGDPESITLSGCSAGGASVNYHYLSPLSKGNFNRGIAFSGASFASWTHSVKPLQKAKALAVIVGCPTNSNKEMVDCLRYRPAEVLVNGQIEMMEWKVHMFTPFTPTVEGPNVRDPFLSQYPYLAAQRGAMIKVPLITSVTSEEGLYPAAFYHTDGTLLKELDLRWEQLASNIFEYNDTLPLVQRPAVAAKIKEHYLHGRPVGQETFQQLVQALGDRLFAAEVGRLAQIHAKLSGAPTYLYRYSFRGDSSLSNYMARNDKNYGVSHADDVFHIFKFSGISNNSPDDIKIREILIDMVYSYASKGVPKMPVDWRPVTPGDSTLNYLQISSPTDISMKSSSDFGQRSFWDRLGFLENENFNPHIVKEEL